MGYLFTEGQTKRDLIAEITKPYQGSESGNDYRCLDHTLKGSTLWSVWEVSDGSRFIRCDLLRSKRGFGWGYKAMDESWEPCYYDCPLRYLDMAESVKPEWRGKVRAYHAEQAAIVTKAKALKIGATVSLVDCNIPCVTISSLKPLLGRYGGRTYRIRKGLLGQIAS